MGERIRFSGTLEGYLARPETRDPGGVVVIQEWWGLDEHIQDVTVRFSREGFLALAPDLYEGRVTRSSDEAQRLLMAMNIDKAGEALEGAASFLQKETGKRVGTVGFCMGGALSLFAACRSGAKVGACVVYYGGHSRVTYAFDGLKAPVLGHFAENDAFVNAKLPEIEEELQKRGLRHTFHTYPGTKHAFFNDTRPAYDAAAARKSWERTLEFFRQEL